MSYESYLREYKSYTDVSQYSSQLLFIDNLKGAEKMEFDRYVAELDPSQVADLQKNASSPKMKRLFALWDVYSGSHYDPVNQNNVDPLVYTGRGLVVNNNGLNGLGNVITLGANNPVSQIVRVVESGTWDSDERLREEYLSKVKLTYMGPSDTDWYVNLIKDSYIDGDPRGYILNVNAYNHTYRSANWFPPDPRIDNNQVTTLQTDEQVKQFYVSDLPRVLAFCLWYSEHRLGGYDKVKYGYVTARDPALSARLKIAQAEYIGGDLLKPSGWLDKAFNSFLLKGVAVLVVGISIKHFFGV